MAQQCGRAEFLQALDSANKSAAAQVAYYGADPYAASDHDPIVIGFNPLAAISMMTASWTRRIRRF